jgi:transposase
MNAYITGVTDNLTEAEIAFDTFHAVTLVNDAVDQVRFGKSKDRPELKRSRYLWLKNERHLSVAQSNPRSAHPHASQNGARLSAAVSLPGDLQPAVP